MAGVKITDLTPLGTAASDDLLYIVDVSDTSESPEGTSKKVELGNLSAALDIISDTFTPTLTSITGMFSTVSNEGVYTKIGDTINFGCKINFTLEATGVGADQNGQFDIDFPEKVNNFSSDFHSFQLTISEGDPNTFNKTIVDNALKATININSIGTGAADFSGVLYLTAIYKI
jgi:hypothetical protein